MKTILPVLTIALMAAGSNANAGENSRPATAGENIGLGTGLVAGALIGGPPGAIIGAALGAHYGGTIQRASKIPELEDDLHASEAELSAAMERAARLRAATSEAEAELDALSHEVARLTTERTLLAGLHMEVLYTTGKADLGDEAKERLETLAYVLNGLPDFGVQLDGFADQRGSEEFNARLSEDRARSVEQLLVAEGVAPERIVVNAMGEAQSQAGDVDGYAMERRVTIRLVDSDGTPLANTLSTQR
ncbi:MAG: OmpA family protein [Pseudomonadota bacterium]